MLDRQVRKRIDPWLEAPARRLAAAGVSANVVSLMGFFLGMAGCVAVASQYYLAGLALILANRLADGLDGCVARCSRATDVGGFLDIVLDLIFYGGVPFAFAVAQPEALLPAGFLVWSFLGTTGSFLAFAVIDARRGVTSDRLGGKSFFYHAGLMEGTETVLFFTLFCLFPQHFATLAWIFGALCWLTVAVRITAGVAAFRPPERQYGVREGAPAARPSAHEAAP
ncbi:MAG: CDP-alcohol phosphatidyltransferase family protein [Planctomycetaceae bacterium]